MVQVDIQTNGLELTPPLEEHIDKAVHKISQIDEHVTLITVFLEIQKRKDDNGCSVTYKVERPGKNILVKEKGDDMYEVLGRAMKTTVRDVRKIKEKEHQH